MKQVSEKEKSFLKDIGLVQLLLYVCAENLSDFKWNNLSIKWDSIDYQKEAIIRSETNIFLIKCQEKISYIFLLVAANQKRFLPCESEIENLISKLEINKILVWRNEFIFNQDDKDKVLNIITKLSLLNAHIVLIQQKLKEMGYSEDEQENIFAMHPLYSNTDLLVAAYPERLIFLDKKKLRKYKEVKEDWITNNPILKKQIEQMSW